MRLFFIISIIRKDKFSSTHLGDTDVVALDGKMHRPYPLTAAQMVSRISDISSLLKMAYERAGYASVATSATERHLMKTDDLNRCLILNRNGTRWDHKSIYGDS